ncbi:hypothetical protein BDV96DRAFT_580291 [Lophiotrema nucula]|uniref:Uncharacterized protein n=1 Tax=Lophiotrema nucula TaxID=690887 RepID=A0A6A5Z000_9PLEO|nr:hypothetical protein BDV96DRAFT_580291 [Lophiotrema nucula]
MDLEHVGDISQLGVLNGSVTECFLNLCGKRYDGIETKNGRTTVQQVEEYGLTYTNASEVNLTMQKQYTYQFPDVVALSSSSSKRQYSWNVTSTGDLGLLVQDIFYLCRQLIPCLVTYSNCVVSHHTVLRQPFDSKSDRCSHGPRGLRPCTLGMVPDAPDSNCSDYHFLYPHCVESSSKSYLFKNNILAFLFHGLDGWDTRTATYSDGHGRQRGSTIVATSREM